MINKGTVKTEYTLKANFYFDSRSVYQIKIVMNVISNDNVNQKSQLIFRRTLKMQKKW